jgi:hypothetical protein
MVVWIFPSIEWRWYWVPLSLTPVIGGVLLFEKIRKDGAPRRVKPIPNPLAKFSSQYRRSQS